MDWLLNSNVSDPALPLSSVLLSLLMAAAAGQAVGWIYMATHTSPSYSKTFTSSLVVMPVIVSLMMVLMSGSTVIAFGLLAVFAVVRFRNVLKDTRDTTYILWAIVLGMGLGTQHYTESLAGLIVVGFVMGYLRLSDFGSRHQFDAILSLDLAGDLSGAETSINDLLHRHASKWKRAGDQHLTESSKTIAYELLMRDPSRSDELRAALLNREEVQQISLFINKRDSEI